MAARCYMGRRAIGEWEVDGGFAAEALWCGDLLCRRHVQAHVVALGSVTINARGLQGVVCRREWLVTLLLLSLMARGGPTITLPAATPADGSTCLPHQVTA